MYDKTIWQKCTRTVGTSLQNVVVERTTRRHSRGFYLTRCCILIIGYVRWLFRKWFSLLFGFLRLTLKEQFFAWLLMYRQRCSVYVCFERFRRIFCENEFFIRTCRTLCHICNTSWLEVIVQHSFGFERVIVGVIALWFLIVKSREKIFQTNCLSTSETADWTSSCFMYVLLLFCSLSLSQIYAKMANSIPQRKYDETKK